MSNVHHLRGFNPPAIVQAAVYGEDVTSTKRLCAILQREIRASKLQYKEIAKKAKMDPRTVSNIACGDVKAPQFKTALKLCKVFKLNIQIVRAK